MYENIIRSADYAREPSLCLRDYGWFIPDRKPANRLNMKSSVDAIIAITQVSPNDSPRVW